MIRSQRLALSPNNRQETYFRRASGVARFAYNWAVAEWGKERAQGLKPSWPALARRLNAEKGEKFPWMREVTSYAPAYAVRHFGTAISRFFAKKSRFPTFKRKGDRDGFELHPNEFRIEGRFAVIPKLGRVRIQEAIRWPGVIKAVSIIHRGGRWFLSLAIDAQETIPQCENQASVGVDLGVTTLATLSTGEKIEGPKPHKHLLGRLRRLNKSLHRKVKGSRNRGKAKERLSRLHARILNIRQDAIHKLTHRLTTEFGTVAIEDLNVRSMVRNRRLARSISDASFGEFRRQLTYKAEWRGVRVLVAGRFFPSSKLCSECGALADSLPLSVRSWACPCGAQHDRDVNAARNILAAGLAVSACGEESSGGARKGVAKLAFVKQESINSKVEV